MPATYVFYLGGSTADITGGQWNRYLITETATAGTIQLTPPDNSTWLTGYGIVQAGAMESSHWNAGQITVGVNATNHGRDVIMRVSASRCDEGGNEIETTDYQEQTLSGIGTVTFTIPSFNWGEGNPTDRLRINYAYRGSHSVQGGDVTIQTGTASTEIDTPIVIPFDGLVEAGVASPQADPLAPAEIVVEVNSAYPNPQAGLVNIEGPAPLLDIEVDYVEIQRRLDGGEWEFLTQQRTPPGSFVDDTIPPGTGQAEYRARNYYKLIDYWGDWSNIETVEMAPPGTVYISAPAGQAGADQITPAQKIGIILSLPVKATATQTVIPTVIAAQVESAQVNPPIKNSQVAGQTPQVITTADITILPQPPPVTAQGLPASLPENKVITTPAGLVAGMPTPPIVAITVPDFILATTQVEDFIRLEWEVAE